jgi:hypothetical protein
MYAQEKTGYYINWDIDHTEKSARSSIRISEEESKIVNCYLVKFDKQNRLSSVKYYYSGKPSEYGSYGAHELIRTYQDDSFAEKYKNTLGKFVINSSDVTKRKYTLNAAGFWVKKENFKDDKLVEKGVATSIVTRNSKHEIETEIQYGFQGDTIPDGNGFKIVHFTYNKDGLTLHRQNRTFDGLVINGDQNYATVIFQFDQNGNFFEEQFLDEKDNLFLHPRFDLAKINWRTFNKYGKPSEIYYMDENGYPHSTRAYAVIKYRPNMTREQITYYNRIGEKIVDRNGIASTTYNYDVIGKYLGRSNYDLNNNVIEQ